MVIDASVAVKWFVKDEADADLADDMLVALLAGDLELHAPRIFTYEVCAVLTKACSQRSVSAKSPRLTKELALRCAREVFRLPIRHASADVNEATDSVRMAIECSKTFNDMTYVCLAGALDCHWCTADDKLLRNVPSGFPRDRILLLASLRQSP
ncbi:MAG: type II toxin-antitoxin system VapC family toxin [Phycisphaerales bacterium]|nr:type II toxin-antitoxin system VapC family toxin [Phycisphaerales bacterium]